MPAALTASIRRTGGFTLIEIMVVVAIIAILAAMIVPNIIGRQEEAMIVKARQDVRALETALDFYKLDNYVYPTTDQGLEALVEKPTSPEPPHWKEGGYLKVLPKDPWGHPYQYLNPGTHGVIDVYSLGPDGQPSDDDIGNWQSE